MCTLLEAKPASSQKRSSDASLMPSSTWRLAVVTCGEKHRKGDLKRCMKKMEVSCGLIVVDESAKQ